ncbi:MAG: thiol-disulfide oxidoreductase [Flavobacteriales bacterium]|nr:thiol-disulfide oxidoreductase [Flavobacteriales bacterium]|tara:strand:- start:669 stop:1085 length:417 start_codon:yes stop_codon:yes gene_type:complete
MNNYADNKIIVLFDGVCNMCVWSVRFIINRDINDKFRLASIQSEVGKKIISDKKINIVKNDSIIVIDKDVVRYRSSAVLFILFHLRTLLKIFLIFYIVPPPIRDLKYRIIAKIRYIFFGKRKKCVLPNELNTSKFLNL